jgi:hypothetical protein
MPTSIENLVDIKTLAQQSPVLKPRMVQHWLHANIGGFRDVCAVRIGRRVLLDRAAVDAWLDARRVEKQ